MANLTNGKNDSFAAQMEKTCPSRDQKPELCPAMYPNQNAQGRVCWQYELSSHAFM